MEPIPSLKEWSIRHDGKVHGPFSEVEMRQCLEQLPVDQSEVRQGEGSWHPASKIIAKLETLTQEGIYLRRDQVVVGPFTPDRAYELLKLKDISNVQGKVGLKGDWFSASRLLGRFEKIIALSRGETVEEESSHGEESRSSESILLDEVAGRLGEAERTPRQTPMPVDTSRVWQTCPTCRTPVDVTTAHNGQSIQCNHCPGIVTVIRGSSWGSPLPPRARPLAAAQPSKHAPRATPVPSLRATRVTPLPPTRASRTTPMPRSDEPIEVVAQPIEVIAQPVPEVPQAIVAAQPVGDVSAKRGDASFARYASASTSTRYATPPSAGGKTLRYQLPGIAIMLWGLLVSIGATSVIGFDAYSLFLGELETVGQRVGQIGASFVLALLGLALGLVMFGGGNSLSKGRSSAPACAAAVLAAIPCVGGPMFPFGVWACVTLFGNPSERDFV